MTDKETKKKCRNILIKKKIGKLSEYVSIWSGEVRHYSFRVKFRLKANGTKKSKGQLGKLN